jgi:hypothetical protein
MMMMSVLNYLLGMYYVGVVAADVVVVAKGINTYSVVSDFFIIVLQRSRK